MVESCFFCDVYNNKKEQVVLENEFFFARYDGRPISPGHAEVIPKRHVVDFFDLSPGESVKFYPLMKDVVRHIEGEDKQALYEKILDDMKDNPSAVTYIQRMLNHIGLNKKPDAYNFGINNGSAAGRTIHHLHIHIIPRYEGDMPNPRGGVRNIIPGMGDYNE
jgi:ATP adenylyltransferase